MNAFRNSFFILLSIAFALPEISFAQEKSERLLDYGISVNYPPLSIPRKVLEDGESVSDLNEHYKTSWIKSFMGMTVSTLHEGIEKLAKSKDDKITKQQKDNMLTSDKGSAVTISVKYMPDNTLKHNDIQEYKYSFSIDPDMEAEFPGGKDLMNQYLVENLIPKIPNDVFGKYQLAAVKFTIDGTGHVVDPYLHWTSENEEVDILLLEIVCKMPTWKPAEYNDGTKVKQEFVLTVGDNNSCVMPTLNLRLKNL